uniref:HAT C-terminal dimerisation domain-containing protein n=1 Tax=Lactuca sativa TaxID=4236 RepID=A0A9R1XQG6_LACSA|nr:hypothetical protein LSAT_V11C300138680 [Lactuca sativa]
MDVLAIPISTVASEATFSAGGRVIDPYRSSLAPHTVEKLICGGDWIRHRYGIKKKLKKEEMTIEVLLPTGTNFVGLNLFQGRLAFDLGLFVGV